MINRPRNGLNDFLRKFTWDPDYLDELAEKEQLVKREKLDKK